MTETTETEGIVIQWRPRDDFQWADYVQVEQSEATELLRIHRAAVPTVQWQAVRWTHQTEVLDL